MFVRSFGINWRYAIGEIAIIVIGVLLAISLDNCNEARIARAAEREYLTRLTEDLRADTATFSFVDRALERKTAALAVVDSVITRPTVLRDTLRFLQEIVSGANFAWNIPRVQRTTFEELQSTGNLRLLRDTRLRTAVVRYYAYAEGEYLRIAGRRSSYGPLSYELLPRSREFALDSITARAQSRALVQTLLRSDLAPALRAERNFAGFLAEMNVGLKERAMQLLRDLEGRSTH